MRKARSVWRKAAAIIAMAVVVGSVVYLMRETPMSGSEPSEPAAAVTESSTETKYLERRPENAPIRDSDATRSVLVLPPSMSYEASTVASWDAFNREPTLSPRERDELVTLFTQVRVKRAELEQSLCTIEREPGITRISIPAYVEQGEQLEEYFYLELETSLGEQRGRKIRDEIEAQVALASHGWGRATQVITITKEKSGFFEIQHAIGDRSPPLMEGLLSFRSVSTSRVARHSPAGAYQPWVRYFPE